MKKVKYWLIISLKSVTTLYVKVSARLTVGLECLSAPLLSPKTNN